MLGRDDITVPVEDTPSVENALPEDPAGKATRRTVLRAAGLTTLVAGSGATLVACGADEATAPAAGPASPSAAASSAAASPSESASDSESAAPSQSASGGASSAPATGPTVAASDVPEGGGFIMPNGNYVVTQPTKGTYKAFNKKCTHKGCPVSQIANKEIVCKCHNSHFSIEDGSVLDGPATAPLATAKATLQGEQIVISA